MLADGMGWVGSVCAVGKGSEKCDRDGSRPRERLLENETCFPRDGFAAAK
jgi:hypothetical protein